MYLSGRLWSFIIYVWTLWSIHHNKNLFPLHSIKKYAKTQIKIPTKVGILENSIMELELLVQQELVQQELVQQELLEPQELLVELVELEQQELVLEFQLQQELVLEFQQAS
jgi:hypothetical protein